MFASKWWIHILFLLILNFRSLLYSPLVIRGYHSRVFINTYCLLPMFNIIKNSTDNFILFFRKLRIF
jgi:hypothetical protein